MKKILQLALLILACIPSSSHTMFTHCFPKKTRPSQTIKTPEDVMAEFEKIKQELLDREYAILERLTEPYLTKTELQIVLDYIEQQKQLNCEKMQHPSPYAIHDPNMPEDIYVRLKNELLDNKINPQSVSLSFNKKKGHGNKLAYASVFSPKNNNSPAASIQIYDSLENYPYKKSTISHEAQHVARQHSLDLHYINLIINAQGGNVVELHKRLTSEHEKQADTFAAIKNQENSWELKEECFKSSHSDIIDRKNHCKTLTYVHDLWKLKEQLEKSSHQGATS